MLPTRKSGRGGLALAVVGAFLLFGAAPQLTARSHESNCVKRMRKAEQKVEKEVKRHGQYSRQAQDARQKLEEARLSCAERKR